MSEKSVDTNLSHELFQGASIDYRVYECTNEQDIVQYGTL